MYAYVINNPLKWTDPTGHWCTSDDGKWSHPDGCYYDGNVEIFGGKNYTPDLEHIGDREKRNGTRGGVDFTKDDLDANSTQKDQKQMHDWQLQGYMQGQIESGFPDLRSGINMTMDLLAVLTLRVKPQGGSLKKSGFDAHELKEGVVGGSISNYDIYQDVDTGMLWVFKKGGKGEGIPTYEYIK